MDYRGDNVLSPIYVLQPLLLQLYTILEQYTDWQTHPYCFCDNDQSVHMIIEIIILVWVHIILQNPSYSLSEYLDIKSV